MAIKTQHDVLARMALVPRVMEARGLDVTPSMIDKLENVGDSAGVQILQTIYLEEIEHVRIGSDWYQHICEERRLEPKTTFFKLVREHHYGELKGPFNKEARRAAGFNEEELETLG